MDLPGYGYAKVKTDFRKQWGKLIEGYFNSSNDLKAIFLLMDIRRDPNEDDCMMLDWMAASGLETLVVATKADKVKRQERIRRVNSLKKTLSERLGKEVDLISFSALDKSGRDEIYDVIDGILERSVKNND